MKLFYTRLGVMLAIFMLTIPLQVSALDRVAATFTNGDLYLKEGPVNAVWHQETSGVDIGNVSLSGDRISLLDQGSSQKFVNIKEPAWNSPWNPVYWTDGGSPAATKTLVSRLSNGQYRLMVLNVAGEVVLKDGPLNTGFWSGPNATGISDILIGGDRIGVIDGSNNLYVKQLTPGQFSHPNNTPWQLQATAVLTASISNNWIAYRDIAYDVHAKEGPINAPWFGGNSIIYDTTSEISVAGSRMCVIKLVSNKVECKEGSLGAVSKLTYSNATDAKVSINRIAVTTSGNNAYILEGPLYSANSGWQFVVAGNISNIELN